MVDIIEPTAKYKRSAEGAGKGALVEKVADIILVMINMAKKRIA